MIYHRILNCTQRVLYDDYVVYSIYYILHSSEADVCAPSRNGATALMVEYSKSRWQVNTNMTSHTIKHIQYAMNKHMITQQLQGTNYTSKKHMANEHK